MHDAFVDRVVRKNSGHRSGPRFVGRSPQHLESDVIHLLLHLGALIHLLDELFER
jgi:hypothetical protein